MLALAVVLTVMGVHAKHETRFRSLLNERSQVRHSMLNSTKFGVSDREIGVGIMQLAPDDGRIGKVTYKSFNISELPKEFDWRSAENFQKYGNVTTKVKDQGDCGSCWSVVAIEILESATAIKTGHLEELSYTHVTDCAKNPLHCGGKGGCDGATPEIAFEYLKTIGGALPESAYISSTNDTSNAADGDGGRCMVTGPIHKSNLARAKVDSYKRIKANNMTAVMLALMKYGPLAVGLDASNFVNYTGGIFDCDKQAELYDNFVDVSHAVVLMGWGVEKDTEGNEIPYWSLRNQWGTSFGEGGYIRIKRDDPSKVSCRVDRTPLNGFVCTEIAPGVPNPHINEYEVCGACGILSDVVAVIVPSDEA